MRQQHPASPMPQPGTAFHCRPRSLSDFWLLSSRLVGSLHFWGSLKGGCLMDAFYIKMGFLAMIPIFYGHSMTFPYFKTQVSRHFSISEHTYWKVVSTRIATWQKTTQCEQQDKQTNPQRGDIQKIVAKPRSNTFKLIHERDLNLNQDTLSWWPNVYEVFCVRVLSSVCVWLDVCMFISMCLSKCLWIWINMVLYDTVCVYYIYNMCVWLHVCL